MSAMLTTPKVNVPLKLTGAPETGPVHPLCAPGWEQRWMDCKRRDPAQAKRFYPGVDPNFAAAELFDPVIEGRPGLITKRTPVGAIGSCFAGEIKRWLVEHGYNFIRAEDGPAAVNGSANFGGVFTTAILRQEIEFGYGRFTPREECWPNDGVLVDPYRTPVTWANEDEMRAERTAHARGVREFVERSEVMVWTMGLTEAFRSRVDGSVYARLPSRSVFDPAVHEPHWLDLEENVANLEAAYALVKSKNPKVQLIVTLSPVPLKSSIHPLGCVVADSLSKATLRLAIDRFCRAHPEVIYFPSYEIVTKLTPSWPYIEDNRHIKPETVSRIMRTFMQRFGDLTPETAERARAADVKRALPVGVRSLELSFRLRLMREMWKRLGAECGRKPVAIYGAGKHTDMLLGATAYVAGGPRAAVVIDDQPKCEVMGGIPVRRPREVDPSSVSAVVVSSDSMEETLAARALEWAARAPAGKRPRVERMYEGLPRGPYMVADLIDPMCGAA